MTLISTYELDARAQHHVTFSRCVNGTLWSLCQQLHTVLEHTLSGMCRTRAGETSNNDFLPLEWNHDEGICAGDAHGNMS